MANLYRDRLGVVNFGDKILSSGNCAERDAISLAASERERSCQGSKDVEKNSQHLTGRGIIHHAVGYLRFISNARSLLFLSISMPVAGGSLYAGPNTPTPIKPHSIVLPSLPESPPRFSPDANLTALPIRSHSIGLPPLPKAPPDDPIPPSPPKDPILIACENLRSALKGHVNPLPLVDWLNISNLPSFFEPTVRSLMKREEYFNTIDSLGQYDLAIQPYGFYSNYKLDKELFKLSTFGVTVDGGVALKERWVVGGGLGYWHSNLDWGKHAKGSTVNSLYAGPYAGYLFERAYVDLILLGVYNLYDVNHLIEHEKKGKGRHNGWDASARLEGGIDFEWPRFFGTNFFIQPNADLSYLWVFQNKIEEEGKDEFKAALDSRTYDFFRSRLAVTFRKEFHQVERGILIPSLSVGWVLMQPLSHSKITLTCGESDEEAIKSKAYPSSNQLYAGVKVAAVNKRGMMLSLSADAYMANLYPVYSGNLRFEWDW